MDPIKLFIEHTLYPAMERKKGNRTRLYLAELTRSQSFSRAQLEELQAQRLKKLLTACIREVPAYRDVPVTAAEIEEDPRAALTRFPVLSKREFQSGPDRYLSRSADKQTLIANATGGSTGEPVKFYMDRYAVEHYEAARFRGLSWSGITPGSRSVMIWGNPIELDAYSQKKARVRDRWLKNRIVISAYTLTPDRIREYAGVIDRYRPEYLYGYASALGTFASLMLGTGVGLKTRLKAVVSTSETLRPEQREAMERAFACPVVNEYGARDAGILAYSCPNGNLHITAENAVIEILDPVTKKPVAPGGSGLVVTTDLHNFVMPRLRYILGDLATLSEGECGCGMHLPLIESIDGRQDDLLQLPGGMLVHGNFVNQLTRKRKCIRKFQLVQRSPENADLYVVLDPALPDETEAYVRDLNEIIPGVKIAVHRVDDIPPGKSGKFRYAIRDFALR